MYLISLQSYGFVFTLQNMLGIILFAHAECVLPCGACLVEKNKKNTRDGSFTLRAHAAVATLLAWENKFSTPAP
jgi:hypothetical protein